MPQSPWSRGRSHCSGVVVAAGVDAAAGAAVAAGVVAAPFGGDRLHLVVIGSLLGPRGEDVV